MNTKRRLGRILAVQNIYTVRINLSPPMEAFENLIRDKDYNKESVEFATQLVEKATEHLDEIDNIIKEVIENWEWSRVFAKDKSIIGISVKKHLKFP